MLRRDSKTQGGVLRMKNSRQTAVSPLSNTTTTRRTHANTMADTYFLSIPTGKIAPIRRRGSLAISQHSAHKQTLLRRATIIFAILVMSMGQVWGVNCSLGQAYLKCNFNGSAYKFADTGNDSDYEYVYNTDSHSAHNLGVLSSGSFTLTYLSWHCWNDWKDADEYTENYFWYYVNSGSTTTRQQNWNGRGDFYPKQENISVTIAYATDASGLYTFHHGWYTKYYECCGSSSYTQKDLNNGSSFDFTYTILPPAVSDFTVTPTGVLSGTGTSADPYLIAYDGTLSLTLSGASQAHSDANSSVQYSVDGSSYGTESGNTTKTISNITATTNQSVTVYAKYYNSNDDLSGEVLTKTVYYKTADWVIAGTMDGEATWPLDTHIFTHWGTNASGKDTGFVEMDLAANTTYEFKVVQRSGNTWYGNDGTMNYADNNGQAWDFCTSAGNCGITTAGAGTYRFTWNSTDKQLTVTYPTSYTVTFGSGTGIDGEVTASGSISGSIASGTYAAAGENITFSQTPLDGYTFEGWFTTNGGNTAVTGMSSSDNVLENISANATVYAKYSPITYTITLNPNGGTGGTASVSIGYNETAPNQGYDGNWYFAITNPTRAGYTFSGWNTAADGTGLDLIDTGGILQGNKDGYTTTGTGDAIVWIHTSDVTLYAKWTPTTYSVTLDRQSGTGGSASATATYGSAMPAITVPTRTGYAFGGYFTAANGGGTQYYTASGASAKAWDKAAATTLYAKWSPNSYRISYDANGGTGTMGFSQFYYDTPATLRTNAFTKTNAVFAGWSTEPDGEVVFADGEEILNLYDAYHNLTLYAVWVENAYKVVFDANGGVGAMRPQTCPIGTCTTLAPAAFSRRGATFAGWARTPDGPVAFADGAAVCDLATTVGETVTLYAVWNLPAVASLEIAGPDAIDLYDADSAQFTATCRLADGTVVDVAPRWSVEETAVTNAVVSSDGLVTFPNPEKYTVAARLTVSAGCNGVRASKEVDVWGWSATVAAWTMPQQTLWPGETIRALPQSVIWWRHGVTEEPTSDFTGVSFSFYAYIRGSEWHYLRGGETDSPDGVSIAIPADFESGDGYGYMSVSTRATRCDRTVERSQLAYFAYLAAAPAETVAVTFDANGGEPAAQTSTYAVGVPYGYLPQPYRKGYSLQGWYTAETGGTRVTGETNCLASVTRLFAQWSPKYYRISYDANGGLGYMDGKYFYYDQPDTLRANAFTKVGHAFVGWAAEPDGEVVFDDVPVFKY